MTYQQSAERFIVINTGEKTYECEVRRIDLSELRIDPRNPRLLDIGITQHKVLRVVIQQLMIVLLFLPLVE